MKTGTNFLLAKLCYFFLSSAYAAAILDIVPSSTYPIAIAANGASYLTYTVKNNTTKTLTAITIDSSYGNPGNVLILALNGNQCKQLKPGASCQFTVSIQGNNQATFASLTPRVCAYRGTVCSVPILSNRVLVIASRNIPNSTFPLPYVGTFYPIYNSGPGQWIEPTFSMPFNRINTIFIAFAHTYPYANGAILTYEAGQTDQAARIGRLVQTARLLNPSIKLLISLGWGKNDWAYINTDYVNHANIFIPSVIQFIRANQLDGLDIDDEEIGGTSGRIPQRHFNSVITNLRNALNYASLQDNKPYYLTITPAGNNSQQGGLDDTQVNAANASNFNLINIQTYYNGSETFGQDFLSSLINIGYPATQIANGIDTEKCQPTIPPYLGLAGLFNWNMTADSACNFRYTIEIANLLGYYG
ncbi:glycosyl hydrolase family 18 [Legionella beliardensis]|uniref:chitinase n=1 Tax=Legionella beliardensis TaxID=91822 RepID=A0A378I1G1_9GAMM|nr:glycoside hydrolase family 18 protein [Legionella beliardensis]STX28823.1 glycosyl hydrolase family 18 [Legionella beliardensis]